MNLLRESNGALRENKKQLEAQVKDLQRQLSVLNDSMRPMKEQAIKREADLKALQAEKGR